ncbi:hypothetical protein AVEN_114128-1 [Araneus ventricosus]|uniref:Uncharacterized protein n=1 Tax=Araneus ventricosus TaxID=182803 RepID=A0A4Y2UEE2_ARAVE|nr:hypothetical protein AVEN_114128-1 [Araneus ventricosus]
MNFSFLPSLQRIAAVKVAVSLYNDDDIVYMVEEMEDRIALDYASFNRIRSEGWEEIRKATIEKIKGTVPTCLQNTVVVLLRPLHVEFHWWMEDHPFVNLYTTDNSYKNAICWTSNGTINRIQTAKDFIRNKSLISYGRFLMACTYFLENEVLTLWNEMEEKTISLEDSSLAVRFWVKWLEEGATTPWTQMVEEHFKDADIRPMDTCIRLSSFFHVLSRENRLKYLKFFDCSISHNDDLRRCMYYFHKEERHELCTVDSEGVLRSFLKWPYYSEFLPTANILWPYLTPDSFYSVLRTLLFDYIVKGFKYFDYFHLFKEFWQASPVPLRYNKQRRLCELAKKVLSYDTETSPLTLQEIASEYRSCFSVYQYDRYL